MTWSHRIIEANGCTRLYINVLKLDQCPDPLNPLTQNIPHTFLLV